MVINEVIDYINKLPDADKFESLEEVKREAYIFDAIETINAVYGNINGIKISDRAIALQTLYMIADDFEGFSQLQEQGVAKYSVKGASVEFDSHNHTGISPNVSALIELENPSMSKSGGANVGRLI